jgi:HPr kinase/phosphorylase
MTVAEVPGRSAELTADVLRSPLLADLKLKTVAGEAGFSRVISWGRIQRPGLAFAGFLAFIKPGRIQILGESELNYLDTMPEAERRQRITSICALPVAAFVITGAAGPEDLARECRRREVPLLVSGETTSVVIQSITRVLEDSLAPSASVHGVLVDVYGMGVLLLGDSGIGKSECALDLIQRGHRLVADDVVEIRKYPNGALVGRAAEMIRYHMELRGIGIINIKNLFGVSAVRTS